MTSRYEEALNDKNVDPTDYFKLFSLMSKVLLYRPQCLVNKKGTANSNLRELDQKAKQFFQLHSAALPEILSLHSDRHITIRRY